MMTLLGCIHFPRFLHNSCEVSFLIFLQPWLTSANMFLGESTCLVIFLVSKLVYKLCSHDTQTDSVPLSAKVKHTIKYLPLFALLGFFDLIGTTLGTIGLLYVSSSVYQLFRGAVILFTALFSICVLRRRFEWFRWVGLLLVCSIFHLLHVLHLFYLFQRFFVVCYV